LRNICEPRMDDMCPFTQFAPASAGVVVYFHRSVLEEVQRYFFDSGLHFECRRCGTCCTGAPGTVYVAPDEMTNLAGHVGLSVSDLIDRYLFPYKDSFSIREDARGNCLFFDQGCRVYRVRPFQCRSFPFWFGNLRSEARWEQIRRQCPGIGHGPRFSRAQILAIARKTTMI
jgi:uncharacterized protein